MPHNHMIMNLQECEEATLLPGKNTAIIATSAGPLRLLMTTIFSLLIRSNQKHLEHFIVCINGPDERCGDQSYQNKKQEFLEELRKLKWKDKDMPVTVIRAWSRIGHSQSLEMGIPWVHTEFYTIMHDDIIITNPEWCEEYFNIMQNKEVAIVLPSPMTYGDWGEFIHENRKFIGTQHIASALVVCKKSILTKLGSRWCGYHIIKDYSMSDIDYDKFKSFNLVNLNHGELPKKDESYNGLSFDIGSWVLYHTRLNNYKIGRFEKNPMVHFVSASWNSDKDYLEKRIIEYRPIFEEFEKELQSYPEFNKLYQKYKSI